MSSLTLWQMVERAISNFRHLEPFNFLRVYDWQGLARIPGSFRCLGQQSPCGRIPDLKSLDQPLHYDVCCSQELRVGGDISIRRPPVHAVALWPYIHIVI